MKLRGKINDFSSFVQLKVQTYCYFLSCCVNKSLIISPAEIVQTFYSLHFISLHHKPFILGVSAHAASPLELETKVKRRFAKI